MQIAQITRATMPCVSSFDDGFDAGESRAESLAEGFSDSLTGGTLEDGSTLADFLAEGLTEGCAAKLAEVLRLATGLVPAGEREARNLEVTVAARELFAALQAVYIDNMGGAL